MNNKKIARLMVLPAFLLIAATVPTAGMAASSNKGVETPLQFSERQLRDLSEAVHHARHATAGLVMECERENEVEGGEIDFIGTDIIPIIPATAEGFGGPQYLPPRAKYLQLHMQQLGAVLPLLQSEINGLKAPDKDQADAIVPFTAEMQTLWTDIQKQFAALGPLTMTQPFDSQAIVNAATALNKDLEQIDKVKKDMYKSYKHDPDKGMGR